MSQELLDYARIRHWAENQQPGAIVGESCTNSSCPLARYLEAQTGKPWSVGPSIRPGDGTKENRLHQPIWVKDLILETDGATGHEKGPVTREQFLAVLDQVKRRKS